RHERTSSTPSARRRLSSEPRAPMILVDTSVWIDHFHHTDDHLVGLLDEAAVLQHPLVVGELALGTLRDRSRILDLLQNLPSAPTASHDEVLHFVDVRK